MNLLNARTFSSFIERQKTKWQNIIRIVFRPFFLFFSHFIVCLCFLFIFFDSWTVLFTLFVFSMFGFLFFWGRRTKTKSSESFNNDLLTFVIFGSKQMFAIWFEPIFVTALRPTDKRRTFRLDLWNKNKRNQRTTKKK